MSWRRQLGRIAACSFAAGSLVSVAAGSAGASAQTGDARFNSLNATWRRAVITYTGKLGIVPIFKLAPYTQAFTTETFLYVQGMMGLVTPACLQRQLDGLVSDAVITARDVETAVAQTGQLGHIPNGAATIIEKDASRWSAALSTIDNNACGNFAL